MVTCGALLQDTADTRNLCGLRINQMNGTKTHRGGTKTHRGSPKPAEVQRCSGKRGWDLAFSTQLCQATELSGGEPGA